MERISSLDRRVEDGFKAAAGRFDDANRRFDGMGKRFDGLGRKIDKLPDERAMARVVFYVAGALMAAVIFGPRLMSMIGN